MIRDARAPKLRRARARRENDEDCVGWNVGAGFACDDMRARNQGGDWTAWERGVIDHGVSLVDDCIRAAPRFLIEDLTEEARDVIIGRVATEADERDALIVEVEQSERFDAACCGKGKWKKPGSG